MTSPPSKLPICASHPNPTPAAGAATGGPGIVPGAGSEVVKWVEWSLTGGDGYRMPLRRGGCGCWSIDDARNVSAL